MKARVLECPRCGGVLPRRAALVRVVCEYCKSEVVFERLSVKAADYREALESYRELGAADVVLAGLGLKVHGRLAVGHSTDVFSASRITRLGERLILKVARTDDATGIEREQRALAALEASQARGAQHFSTLLPQRVASGVLERSSFGGKQGAAIREPVGYAHTLAQAKEQFAGGLDARHAVWLWRRTLELLSFIHESGFAHGAILPQHMLIHAREHSTRLVGFSCAGRIGSALFALDQSLEHFYPAERTLSPELDLTMLARCMLFGVGGDPERAPTNLPRELAHLLEREAKRSTTTDAAQLSHEILAVARNCFGPPQFVKLELT